MHKLKLILVAVMAVALITPVLAQDDGSDPKGGMALGIKGYFGFGMPSYENLPAGAASETGSAWAVGLFYNWSTKGIISFGLQPELHYVSESGLKTNLLSEDGDVFEVTSTVNSLRVPVLAKLQFLDPHIVQPSIYIGPSFSYVLSATNEINGTEQDITGTDFKVGLAAGIDVTVLSFLVVDIRYNTKFTELTYDIGQYENFSLAMSSLKFGLGLRF